MSIVEALIQVQDAALALFGLLPFHSTRSTKSEDAIGSEHGTGIRPNDFVEIVHQALEGLPDHVSAALTAEIASSIPIEGDTLSVRAIIDCALQQATHGLGGRGGVQVKAWSSAGEAHILIKLIASPDLLTVDSSAIKSILASLDGQLEVIQSNTGMSAIHVKLPTANRLRVVSKLSTPQAPQPA